MLKESEADTGARSRAMLTVQKPMEGQVVTTVPLTAVLLMAVPLTAVPLTAVPLTTVEKEKRKARKLSIIILPQTLPLMSKLTAQRHLEVMGMEYHMVIQVVVVDIIVVKENQQQVSYLSVLVNWWWV